MEYILVATNHDMLLFKLLTFWGGGGGLLTEACYCSRLYGIRILLTCKRRNRFFPSTATNNSFVSLYILKHFSAQSVSVSIICWTLFQIFISTSWNAIVKKEGIPTLRRFVGSTLMTFEGLNSPRGYSRLRTEMNKKSKPLKKVYHSMKGRFPISTVWNPTNCPCTQIFQKNIYISLICIESGCGEQW